MKEWTYSRNGDRRIPLFRNHFVDGVAVLVSPGEVPYLKSIMITDDEGWSAVVGSGVGRK